MDSLICTKSKIIFLIAITFFFTATVSFAQQTLVIKINCPDEKTVAIPPDVTLVKFDFNDCCCFGSVDEVRTFALNAMRYAMDNYIKRYGVDEGLSPELKKQKEEELHFGMWIGLVQEIQGSNPCQNRDKKEVIKDDLPFGVGDSKDYTYKFCYTNQQLKDYLIEILKFLLAAKYGK